MHFVTTCSGCTFCRLFAFPYFLHLFGVPEVVSIKVAPLLVSVCKMPLFGGVYQLPTSLWWLTACITPLQVALSYLQIYLHQASIFLLYTLQHLLETYISPCKPPNPHNPPKCFSAFSIKCQLSVLTLSLLQPSLLKVLLH